MTTKDKIISAAKEVFHKKGYSGARMQEIADLSGINKALLHYHFKNKDVLFRSVLMAGFMDVFPIIFGILNSKLELKVKINTFVETYIDHISKNPNLPLFVLNELGQNPNFINDLLGSTNLHPDEFIHQIQHAISNNEITETDPFQIIIDMVGLCVFPFIGKPMIKLISKKSEKEYLQFVQDRKKHVQNLLFNGLFK
jgi:AcrR family transcriptional regulator